MKKRRLSLGLKQNDMMLRIGVSRQQYQRLESKGNPRLSTLELIAKGLNSKLLLIPQEKLLPVLAVLESNESRKSLSTADKSKKRQATNYDDDPWRDLLEED